MNNILVKNILKKQMIKRKKCAKCLPNCRNNSWDDAGCILQFEERI